MSTAAESPVAQVEEIAVVPGSVDYPSLLQLENGRSRCRRKSCPTMTKSHFGGTPRSLANVGMAQTQVAAMRQHFVSDCPTMSAKMAYIYIYTLTQPTSGQLTLP